MPGMREHMWLGTYAMLVAAAVAHVASTCLLRGSAVRYLLNFLDHVTCYHGR
jgi:hypothetical protein